MSVIFVLLFLIRDSLLQCELPYEISPAYLEDTEKYVPYTPPINEGVWVSYKDHAENTGYLFAGKSEFPWVVDIRADFRNQEFWAIGNLYSSNFVMTTCRAKQYLEEAARRNGPSGTVKVTFFPLYFKENLENTKYAGVRQIERYYEHHSCDAKVLAYDLAMLQLKYAVDPAPPYLGYLSFPNNNPDRKFATVEFSRLEAQKKVCFVGSVGRGYVNQKTHLVTDFKVSFRVYHEEMTNCTSLFDRLCNSFKHRCEFAFSNRGVSGRDWECMRTRAWVGTVCDHDRGAPVVCDGEVVGFVGYGALYQYCNNRIPMPFIVIKLQPHSAWLRSIAYGPLFRQ